LLKRNFAEETDKKGRFMKTILITGSNGLLGQKLVRRFRDCNNYNIVATSFSPDRMEEEGYIFELMDITNPVEVDYVLSKHRPSVIIHTAAITQADTCETHKKECWDTNVQAVETLLKGAAKSQAHFIHLSSDFVFDGKAGPYSESDPAGPVNYYGISKLESEKAVMRYRGKWTVVRTSLVFGINPSLARPNFVLWLRYALMEGQKVKVNNDQFRTPTLAEDLAEGLIALTEREKTGIFHMAGGEFMSILELAEKVAKYFRLDQSLIEAVSTKELHETGVRPMKAGLRIEKAFHEIGYRPHTFMEALEILDQQIQQQDMNEF